MTQDYFQTLELMEPVYRHNDIDHIMILTNLAMPLVLLSKFISKGSHLTHASKIC